MELPTVTLAHELTVVKYDAEDFKQKWDLEDLDVGKLEPLIEEAETLEFPEIPSTNPLAAGIPPPFPKLDVLEMEKEAEPDVGKLNPNKESLYYHPVASIEKKIEAKEKKRSLKKSVQILASKKKETVIGRNFLEQKISQAVNLVKITNPAIGENVTRFLRRSTLKVKLVF